MIGLRSLRLFISSTLGELSDLRNTVRREVSALRQIPVAFEHLEYRAPINIGKLEHCLAEVGRCDALILIVGHRYGDSVTIAGITASMVHHEFLAAVRIGMPIWAFVKKDVESDFNRWRAQSPVGGDLTDVEPSAAYETERGVFDLLQEVSSSRGPIYRATFSHTNEVLDTLCEQIPRLMFQDEPFVWPVPRSLISPPPLLAAIVEGSAPQNWKHLNDSADTLERLIRDGVRDPLALAGLDAVRTRTLSAFCSHEETVLTGIVRPRRRSRHTVFFATDSNSDPLRIRWWSQNVFFERIKAGSLRAMDEQRHPLFYVRVFLLYRIGDLLSQPGLTQWLRAILSFHRTARIRCAFVCGSSTAHLGDRLDNFFLIQPARSIAGSSVLIADQIAGKTYELKDPSLIAFYSTVREQLVDTANRNESGFWLDSCDWNESHIIRRLMDIGRFCGLEHTRHHASL